MRERSPPPNLRAGKGNERRDDGPARMGRTCRYCEMIRGRSRQYRGKPARHALDSTHPRCDLHWRFVCAVCGGARHFNAIGFCPREEAFFCLGCAPEHRADNREFWAWPYAYRLRCPWREEWHPALDRLEYEGRHPWQARPSWGRARRGMARSEEIPDRWLFRAGPMEGITAADVRRGWDDIATWWVSRYSSKGDVNREWVIDPALLRILGDVRGRKVLDAGCGTGYLSRILAKAGARVVGVDVSRRLLETARAEQDRERLAIRYRLGDLARLPRFRDGTFDIAVSNVVLQDVLRLRIAVREIHRVLRPGGRFVFSITHPAFEAPVPGRWVIEPADSERIEHRRGMLVDRYFDRAAVYWGPAGKPLAVGFHRPLRDYFEALHGAGFVVSRLEEPLPLPEALRRFPRDFRDMLRLPNFLIVEAVKPA